MDCFARLGLPRRAALTEAQVTEAYFAAVAERAGSAELHEAYETLLRPERRLKALLELDGPPEASAWRTVPMSEELMNVFLRLGNARSSAEALIAKKQGTSSALAQALLERQVLVQRDDLECLGLAIDEQRTALTGSLLGLEGQWQSLATIQAQLSYLSKWQTQIAELLLRLM
jgi:hypothetical protein